MVRPRAPEERMDAQTANCPIRVLHLIGSGGHGGVNSFVLQLLKGIDRSRFSLGVCSFGGEGVVLDEMRGLGIDACTLNPEGKYGPQAVFRYFRHITSGGYKIVHAHVGARIPRLVARMSGCRTIAHAHGPPEASSDRIRERDPSLKSSFRTAFGVGSDLIVACSGHTGLMLKTICPELASRVRVIYNGIELDRWQLAGTGDRIQRKLAVGLTGDAVVVGFAGRLVPLKRVDCLVEAAEYSIARHGNLSFVVLGDGALRPALEHRAAALGGRFRFLGWQATADWMPLFDMLVLPSESEGLPLCILEAMACAIPVIAASVGGIPEAVIDGVTGILVPPGDSQALSRAIDSLAGDLDMRRKMGLAGKARAEELFDSRLMTRRFEDLYANLHRSPTRRCQLEDRN